MVYCVLANRVRVKAQFKQTFRGGVHTNLLRNCDLKICLCCSKVAVLFDSDSEEEEFIGFTTNLPKPLYIHILTHAIHPALKMVSLKAKQ